MNMEYHAFEFFAGYLLLIRDRIMSLSLYSMIDRLGGTHC